MMGREGHEIIVKTETILYTVIKYCDSRMYGVPDILSGRNIADFPAIENDALDDLMQNECATMDFNGKVEIAQGYLDCIRDCAKCREVAGIDIKRPDGRQDHMTVYYMGKDSDCIVLKNIDGNFAGVCCIFQSSIEDLIDRVNDVVDVDSSGDLLSGEYRLESSIVKSGNKEIIRKCGCGESASQLISGISKGKITALITRKLHGDSEVGFFSAIWSEEGSMEMKVEYSNFMENIIFKPLSKDEITSKVKEIVEI